MDLCFYGPMRPYSSRCVIPRYKCIAMIEPQTVNIFVLISSVGVHRRDAFIRVQKSSTDD